MSTLPWETLFQFGDDASPRMIYLLKQLELKAGSGAAAEPNNYSCLFQGGTLNVSTIGWHPFAPNSAYNNQVESVLGPIPPLLGISNALSGADSNFAVTKDGIFSGSFTGRLSARDTTWQGYVSLFSNWNQTFEQGLSADFPRACAAFAGIGLHAGATIDTGVLTTVAATGTVNLVGIQFVLSRLPP